MALKSLLLRKKINEKRAELDKLKEQAAELDTRSTELEAALEEASTDEEISAVEAEIEQHDNDTIDNQTKSATLQEEIDDLEKELEGVEQKSSNPAGKDGGKTRESLQPGLGQERNETSMIHTMSMRAAIRESLGIREVRDFYTQVADAMKNRAVESVEITIPDIVMNRIDERMGDYATLAREVESVNVGGTTRIIIDGNDPEGIWVEQTGALSELQTSLVQVQLDGYKVGGFMTVPNSIIEDSFINLADYIETKIAKAIAKAKDKAILSGTGSTGKQPEGIIPALHANNKPAAFAFNLGEIISKIALVDDGEETYGEIIAVMKRSTFYRFFAKNLITTDSAGRYVVPNLSKPNIGVRVVMSQYMPANKVLLGDFKRYLFTVRSGIKLAKSTEYKFIEEQTVIKGTQRLDGKPIHVDTNGKTKDWVLIELTDGVDDGVNFTDLNEAVVTAYGLTEATYTAETWSAMETTLAAAVAVANDAESTQAEVDAAETALETAINALAEA
jgi:HK97 family phage major capsid protein